MKTICIVVLALMIVIPASYAATQTQFSEIKSFYVQITMNGDKGVFSQDEVKSEYQSISEDKYAYIDMKPGDVNDTVLKLTSAGSPAYNLTTTITIRYRNITANCDQDGTSQNIYYVYTNSTGTHTIDIYVDHWGHVQVANADTPTQSTQIGNASVANDTTYIITELHNGIGISVNGGKEKIFWTDNPTFSYLEFLLMGQSDNNGPPDPTNGYILKNIVMKDINGNVLYDAHHFGYYANDYGFPNAIYTSNTQHIIAKAFFSKVFGFSDSSSLFIQPFTDGTFWQSISFNLSGNTTYTVHFKIFFQSVDIVDFQTGKNGTWKIAPGLILYNQTLSILGHNYSVQAGKWYDISYNDSGNTFYFESASGWNGFSQSQDKGIYIDDFSLDTQNGIQINFTNEDIHFSTPDDTSNDTAGVGIVNIQNAGITNYVYILAAAVIFAIIIFAEVRRRL